MGGIYPGGYLDADLRAEVYVRAQREKPGIDAVMMDFAHVMIEMMRFNTPFLNFFWYNSPLPDFKHGMNIGYWIIYILVFVGMALQASGARMGRQAKFLREGVEDQLILEQAKGTEGLTREQISARVVVPRHTILVQYFPLYVLPVIIIVLGYFFFSLLGFCKQSARMPRAG